MEEWVGEGEGRLLEYIYCALLPVLYVVIMFTSDEENEGRRINLAQRQKWQN